MVVLTLGELWLPHVGVRAFRHGRSRSNTALGAMARMIAIGVAGFWRTKPHINSAVGQNPRLYHQLRDGPSTR